jgi:hypothetical protein
MPVSLTVRAALTDHARQRAEQRLGVCPPLDWWRNLAEQILGWKPVRRSDFGQGLVFVYEFTGVDPEGTDVPLGVAVKTYRYRVPGKVELVDVIVSFVSLWIVDREQPAECSSARLVEPACESTSTTARP